jgi:hypothetical protein
MWRSIFEPRKHERRKDFQFTLCYWRFGGFLLFLLLSACDLVGTDPTITPTRALSGPTLEPSATIVIQTSDELAGTISAGQNEPTAAAVQSGGALPPLPIASEAPGSVVQTVEIPVSETVKLVGDLYESGVARVPAVLILGADRKAWGDFPAKVQAAGFTVLVMQTPASADDFRTVMLTLSDAGTVNPGRMAVIGAEGGADMTLIGCAVDMLCKTAVLLSPLDQATLLNVLKDYNPRPLMMTASQNDTQSFPVVQALQAAATGEVLVQPLEVGTRGAALLQARPDLGDLIIQWLQRQLGS